MRTRPDPLRRVEVLRLPHTPAEPSVLPAERPATTRAGNERWVPDVRLRTADEVATDSGRHRQVVTDESGNNDPRTIVGGWIPDRGADGFSSGANVDDADVAEPEAMSGENEFNDPEDDFEEAQDDAQVIRPRRVGRTWGRFAELWVPENIRDARVDPGRRGALVLLLVAALAAVATAFGVWRDRPEPRPVETTALAQLRVSTIPTSSDGATPGLDVPGSGAATTAATGTPADQAEIVVSVTGLVISPGVVTLPNGSRVADAIAAAGGVADGADLTGLNLAAKLSDGESVVVGDSATAAAARSSGASGISGGAGDSAGAGSGGLINLNTADEAALDTLPGVGPVMAQNILAWRDANGKFTSIEQLQEISGIGPSRYAQISPLVAVS